MASGAKRAALFSQLLQSKILADVATPNGF